MKKILLTFSLLSFVAVVSNAQSVGMSLDNNTQNANNSAPADVKVQNPNAPTITFDSEVIDYGTIEQGADGVREFKFVNNGKEPLIISNAKGSCGCTVPTWPKEPIKPGESSIIKVKYDTKRLGAINKSVTITSNAAEPRVVIRIKGKIIAPQTAPVKESLGAPAAN
jgi:hypothetical protein